MDNKYEIEINGHAITCLEYEGQRVITFSMIDELHGRAEGTARKRFNDNRSRFIEGEDYFVRKTDEALREFGITAPNGLFLITESGYLMLVKSLRDDLSWKIQRSLVNTYFKYNDPNYDRDSDFEAKIRKLKEQHEAEITTLKKQYAEEIDRLTKQYEVERFRLIGQHDVEIGDIIEQHNEYVSKMNKREEQYRDEITALKETRRIVINTDVTANATLILSSIQNKHRISVGQISQFYDMSAYDFNVLLKDMGVQVKGPDNVWQLTYEYATEGYVHHVRFDNPECPKTMYWTSLGVAFLVGLLADHNLYPITAN